MMTPSPEESIDVRVARRLRMARINAGLTVREAAARLGTDDHSLLVRYENGAVRPPLERLHALAQAYGLTASALLASDDTLVPLIAALERANPQVWASLAEMLTD
jgi:transcriptional regulator with XRE-family HTH domain